MLKRNLLILATILISLNDTNISAGQTSGFSISNKISGTSKSPIIVITQKTAPEGTKLLPNESTKAYTINPGQTKIIQESFIQAIYTPMHRKSDEFNPAVRLPAESGSTDFKQPNFIAEKGFTMQPGTKYQVINRLGLSYFEAIPITK